MSTPPPPSRAACPAPETLAAALGAARSDPAAAADAGVGLPPALEAHLAECAACRHEAAAFALQAEAPSEGERALLEGLALDELASERLLRAAARRAGPRALLLAPGAPAALGAPGAPGAIAGATAPVEVRRPVQRPRRARLLAGAATIAAAASVAFLLRPAPPPEALVATLSVGSRPLDGALSSLPYAPYQPTRGEAANGADGVLSRLLAAKERRAPGAERALAAFYLWRGEAGDAARAEALLRGAPRAAAGESDLAALALGQGDAAAALDHALVARAAEPGLAVAAFNQGLSLAALGLHAEARRAFAAVTEGPWAAEASRRAAALPAPGDCAAAPKRPGGERLAAVRALFSVRTAEGRSAALAQIAALSEADAGLARDLSRLGERVEAWTPAQLADHGALWDRYAALKAEASAGRAAPGATQALAEAASTDALLAVPALGLLAFDLQQRGEARAARPFYRKILVRCGAGACTAESEAIALDELADAAGHDGDFTEAHRLQDLSEALLQARGAGLQLAELQGKRAVLLAAEGRLPAAAAQAQRSLVSLAGSCAPPPVRAQALLVAETIASDRGLTRAAAALDEAGLALLEAEPASPVAVRLARSLAVARSLLGTPAAARALVEQERARQQAAGDRRGALELRAQLARLAESAGDHAAALAEARRGLAEAEAAQGTFSTKPSIAWLRLLEARALAQAAAKAPPQEAQALRAQAEAGLALLVETAASAALHDDVPESARALALGGAAREAAVELAALGLQQGRPPAALLAPLERLRAAALHAQEPASAPEAWPRTLPDSACLVALLPRQQDVVRVVLAREAAEASLLPVDGLALRALVEEVRAAKAGAREIAPGEERLGEALFGSLPPACANARQVALLAEAPLGRVDLTALPVQGERLGLRTAAVVLSTVDRWLAPKPKAAAGALLVHGAVTGGGGQALAAALPATALEAESLRAAFGAVSELSGPAATADALLARLPAIGLLHVAVHGAAGAREGGGYLLLSAGPGEEPRLPVEQLERAHLAPGARVVLAACHAASAESGLGLAFLRAGAATVVAARGEVDDAAAARWAALFYPALARGLSVAEANRAALRGQPGSGPRAWFTVLE